MQGLKPSLDKKSKNKNEPLKMPKIALRIGVALAFLLFLALLVILIFFGHIPMIYQIFGWLAHQIRVSTGLDLMVANALASLLMALAVSFPFWQFIKSLLFKKWESWAIFLACAAIYWSAIYFSSQNIFFDVYSGEPMKYYSISYDGNYQFYSSSGYDAITGDKLKKVNKDVVVDYLHQIDAQKKALEKKMAWQQKTNSAPKSNEQNKIPQTPRQETKGLVVSNQGMVINYSNETLIMGFDPELCPPLGEPAKLVATLDLSRYKSWLSLSFTLRQGQEKILSLPEGRHYFAFINMNGDNLSPDIVDNSIAGVSGYISDSTGRLVPVCARDGKILEQFKFSYLSCSKIYWSDVGAEANFSEYGYADYHNYVKDKIRQDAKAGPPLLFAGQKYPIKIAYIFTVPTVPGWIIKIENMGISFINKRR